MEDHKTWEEIKSIIKTKFPAKERWELFTVSEGDWQMPCLNCGGHSIRGHNVAAVNESLQGCHSKGWQLPSISIDCEEHIFFTWKNTEPYPNQTYITVVLRSDSMAMRYFYSTPNYLLIGDVKQ